MTNSSETIESLYVADTHALYWYLTNDKKLSQTALTIFEAAERGETQIVISAIAVAELYYVNKKWHVFDDFAQVFHEIKARPEYVFVPFNPDDVLDFDQDASVPEMHDRIITGLARRLDAPLMTTDPLITSSGLVQVVW